MHVLLCYMPAVHIRQKIYMSNICGIKIRDLHLFQKQ